jgi:hypothetical protein
MKKTAEDCIPQSPPRDRRNTASDEATNILNKRQEEILQHNAEETHQLTKQLKKTKRKGKMKQLIDSVDNELDTRDWWDGIRRMKQNIKPIPFSRNSKDGAHIPPLETCRNRAPNT